MTRIVIREYEKSIHGIRLLSKKTGLKENEIRGMFTAKGVDISNILGLKENPVKLIDDSIKIIKVAGIIRLNSNIEIEIIPKFLNPNMNGSWREDFFFLAMVSKHGKLLDTDKLASSLFGDNNLDTILAKILIDMYNKNSRRPIRSYNKCVYSDFSLDGEFEPESLMFPKEDGFEQFEFKYNNQNMYNAVISKAMLEINKNIKEPSIKYSLNRIINTLKVNKSYNLDKTLNKVPNRNSNWQGLYSVSLDILKGNRLNLRVGDIFSPGYIIDTWRVWEDFLNITMAIAFGNKRISVQKQSQLGVRYLVDNAEIISKTEAIVKPDIIVYKAEINEIYFLMDAKYKAKYDKQYLRISQSDLYEALAFLGATKCDTIFLAYPSEQSDNKDLGSVSVFETIHVGGLKVIGVHVYVQGISQKNGLLNFSRKVKQNIEEILKKL